MKYGIVLGRWTGIFTPLYYADVMVDENRDIIYASFSSFTKSGALRKAKRYIKRLSNGSNIEEIYAYDSTSHKLERVV